MTKPAFSVPRRWASDTNYSSGPDNGTPTKVDPGSARAAQGWVPGDPVAAQHLNDMLAGAVAATRRQLATQALHARLTDAAPTDVSQFLAAVAVGPAATAEGLHALAIKGDAAYKVEDSGHVASAGALTSVTSNVRGAAYDPVAGRIVVIGSGGNLNCVSTDLGVNWAAGGALGATCQDIVWNATLGRFMALASSGSSVRRSADGASWAGSTPSLSVSSLGGIAVLSSGRTVVCGNDGGSFPRFSITDDGSTWSDSGGFPADGGLSFLTHGYICGNGGDVIWHAGTRGSPSSGLRISSSPDGVNWTTIADFTTAADNIPPAALQPDSTIPRLMCCQNTGMLVVVGSKSASVGGTWALASFDAGVTWTEPVYFAGSVTSQLAVANGKLFYTTAGNIFQSDGVGWR